MCKFWRDEVENVTVRCSTLQVGGLVLGGRLLVVHHTLDDAVHGVQQIGVLAHGQHSVDLGVQQVVTVEGHKKNINRNKTVFYLKASKNIF